MEIVLLDPLKVHVREGLERYRKDMGDLKSLAKSIKEKRQIMPIVITRDYELIDGGRRLAACIMAGVDVKAVFEDCIDDFEMRELEIEANLYRKDFTPAEEVCAIRDLHDLKVKRHGKGTSGIVGGNSGWTIQKTAELIGKTHASVVQAIQMAELVDAFPDLAKAKKKTEIKKAAQGLERMADAILSAKKHENAIKANEDLFKIYCEDALVHMKSIPSNSIDILLTDPLYGIDADKTAGAIGGKTGGTLTTCGFKIEDCRDKGLFYYEALARESMRFTHSKSQGYIFVGPEHFRTVSEIFTASNWRVHIKPIIWIKRETGQCNVPAYWPASCYEMCLFIRRDDARLIKQGMPDWVECDPIIPSQRRHPYEKPVKLLTNLLERVTLPGNNVYDPFMGSGSTIEASTRLKLFSIGCDISQEAYVQALDRMVKVMVELNRNNT